MSDVIEETKKRILNKYLLLEFANVNKRDYNTPVGFWIDELGNKRNVSHNDPRMKLVNNYNEDFSDLIDISISENPEIFDKENLKLDAKTVKEMKKFISKNCEIFMKRWNNEITTKEMFYLLDENN